MACLTSGAILISIGVLGEYVGRIFEATKERPLYIIASSIRGRQAAAPAPAADDPVAEQLAALSGVQRES